MVKDCVIVGAGIVGTTIARHLLKQGVEVTLLDSGERLAGTGPSGGHLKKSWYEGLGSKVYDPSLEVLHSVYPVLEEDMLLENGSTTRIQRIDTDRIHEGLEICRNKVTRIDRIESNCPTLTVEVYKRTTDRNGTTITSVESEEVRCRNLIVTAGVWCKELLPQVFTDENELVGKVGVSFRVPMKLHQPFIRVWAPYKQLVAHQQTASRCWVGDGTAILESHWTRDKKLECYQRCTAELKYTGEKSSVQEMVGIRPYLKSGFGKVSAPYKHVWVATGFGKHGTIMSGYCAQVIGRRLS